MQPFPIISTTRSLRVQRWFARFPEQPWKAAPDCPFANPLTLQLGRGGSDMVVRLALGGRSAGFIRDQETKLGKPHKFPGQGGRQSTGKGSATTWGRTQEWHPTERQSFKHASLTYRPKLFCLFLFLSFFFFFSRQYGILTGTKAFVLLSLIYMEKSPV